MSKRTSDTADLNDDLCPEYDFSKMKSLGRGIYAERYHKGHNVRLLESEIAQEFPTSEAVNEALRDYLRIKAKSA
jgi:hypothetical protein